MHFEKMVAETKLSFRASDIRAAVRPLFSKYRLSDHKGFNFPMEIPTNEIPKEITSLPIFSEGLEYLSGGSINAHPNVLSFVTGGGFGHWGIVICEEPDPAKYNFHGDKRFILWEDGVYFYRE